MMPQVPASAMLVQCSVVVLVQRHLQPPTRTVLAVPVIIRTCNRGKFLLVLHVI